MLVNLTLIGKFRSILYTVFTPRVAGIYTMPTITKRKGKTGTSYRVQVCVKGVRDGATFKLRADAVAWGRTREAQLAGAEVETGSSRTVRELLTEYRDKITPSKATERHETDRINAFIRDYPHLADMPLDDFDTPHLAEWRDDRLKTVKGSTVLRELSIYRDAWTLARLEWKWTKRNPFESLRPPKDSPPRDRLIDPWKEVRPVLRALGYTTGKAPQSLSQEVALAFLVALRSGMRSGEILQLGKRTVDIERRVARVSHKTQHLTGKPRAIPLSRHVLRLLGPVLDREHFFTVADSTRDALFRRARERRGLSGFTFHDSRASALTRLARKVDVLTLSKISGHADLKMLARVYYRETPESIAGRLATI